MATDMGKLPNKEITILRIIWERCSKRHFHGIHRRFVNGPEFRASQLEHDRDEEVCIKMDELAQKGFSHHMTQAEYFRYKRNWWISLNNSRTSGPLKNRSDFNEALSTLHHLHQEFGERQLRPAPSWKYQYWHQSSSSSSSWWQWSDWNESPHMSDVQSDRIERRNLLFAVFGSNLRRATFMIFL